METSLKIERDQGCDVAELLQDGCNHHSTETHWVSRNHEKCELPHQGDTQETVIKTGMGDWRRVLSSDHIKHKIERCEEERPKCWQSKRRSLQISWLLLFPADGQAINPDCGRGDGAAKFEIAGDF